MRPLLRSLLVLSTTLLALTVELSVAPHLHLPAAVPDLCLLAVIGYVAAWGAAAGMVCGFLTGFAQDIAPPAVGAIGRHALILTLVGALAGKAATEVRRSALSTSLLAAIAAFAAGAADLLLGLLLGDGTRLTRPGLMTGLLASALYTGVATPLVVPGIAALGRRIAAPRPQLLAPAVYALDDGARISRAFTRVRSHRAQGRV